MFQVFLDKALHVTPGLHSSDDAVAEDTHARFDAAVASAACIGAKSSVLEIGAGWGALPSYAIPKHACRCCFLPHLFVM
jgi:cyclopropane fatty-acyl-phospholipid synthase-like methyltransferase